MASAYRTHTDKHAHMDITHYTLANGTLYLHVLRYNSKNVKKMNIIWCHTPSVRALLRQRQADL